MEYIGFSFLTGIARESKAAKRNADVAKNRKTESMK